MSNQVAAEAEGASAGLFANAANNLIRVRKATAWAGESVAVEFNTVDDPDTYDPLTDADGPVVLTGNGSRVVPGGLWYRQVVTDHAGAPIILSTHHVNVD